MQIQNTNNQPSFRMKININTEKAFSAGKDVLDKNQIYKLKSYAEGKCKDIQSTDFTIIGNADGLYELFGRVLKDDKETIINFSPKKVEGLNVKRPFIAIKNAINSLDWHQLWEDKLI